MKAILTIALAVLTFYAFAQPKFGHINSSEIINLMPELKAAQQQLQATSREFEESLRSMSTEFQNQLAEFQANQAQWSNLIRQTRERSLMDLQARLEDFQQNARRELENLEVALFSSIFERFREAVAAIAKEHRYTYIFDTAGTTLLFAAESDNIADLVKAKLNLR